MKARLSNILLMLSLVGFAINIGGTFYQMTVIIPEWSNELPLSVSRFFDDGKWAAAQFRFWTHPLTDGGVLFFLAALIVSWRYTTQPINSHPPAPLANIFLTTAGAATFKASARFFLSLAA